MTFLECWRLDDPISLSFVQSVQRLRNWCSSDYSAMSLVVRSILGLVSPLAVPGSVG